MNLTDSKFQNIHLIILVSVVIFFWDTLLIYPIKLFVVMLHEMSHGLMAVAFGGEIIEIQISPRIGGYCKFRIEPGFWSSFFTISAGYLGSLFWGSLILILAFKLKKDKYITLIIGIVLLILSYFVLQSKEFFGTAMTAGLGIFMLIAFKYFGAFFHDLWLKFIGIISCTYVVLDIKRDLIDNSNIGSDADALSLLIGLPSVSIGIIWMVLALLNLFLVLRYIYKKQRSQLNTKI